MPATTGGPRITVTQGDIRAIQLAKSALYAGARLLDGRAGRRQGGPRGAGRGLRRAYLDQARDGAGDDPRRAAGQGDLAGNAAGHRRADRARATSRRAAEIERVVREITKVETAIEPRFQEHFVAANAIPHKTDPFPELAKIVTLPEVTFNTGGGGAGRRRAAPAALARRLSKRGGRDFPPLHAQRIAPDARVGAIAPVAGHGRAASARCGVAPPGDNQSKEAGEARCAPTRGPVYRTCRGARSGTGWREPGPDRKSAMHARKIILCFDGTGNEIGDDESNILKLYKGLVQSEDQIAHYIPGVGTFDGPRLFGSRLVRKARSFAGLAFGMGLEDDVLDAYRFLCHTYQSSKAKRAAETRRRTGQAAGPAARPQGARAAGARPAGRGRSHLHLRLLARRLCRAHPRRVHPQFRTGLPRSPAHDHRGVPRLPVGDRQRPQHPR